VFGSRRFAQLPDAATVLRLAFFPFPFNVFFPRERQNHTIYSDKIGTPCDRSGTGATQDEVRVESGSKSVSTAVVESASRKIQERSPV